MMDTLDDFFQLWFVEMEWQYEWAFYVLPLPLLALLLPRAQRQLAALKLPFFSTLETRTSKPKFRWPWLFAIVPIWALLVVTAAGPIQLGKSIALPSEGRDILLAIDLSGSMGYEDMVLKGREVDRLTAVQNIAGDFIKGREGDRIGLVLFATQAYLMAPLTPDRRTVYQLLRESEIGLAGGQSTAIGDAIGMGIKHLQKRPADHRILILLTDGESNEGVPPIQATEYAKAADVKVYTIGFGSRRGIDTRTLNTIANMTGGQYFFASNTTRLSEIYDILDKLEPIAEDAGSYRPRKSRAFDVLVIAGLASLACLVLVVLFRLLALLFRPSMTATAAKPTT